MTRGARAALRPRRHHLRHAIAVVVLMLASFATPAQASARCAAAGQAREAEEAVLNARPGHQRVVDRAVAGSATGQGVFVTYEDWDTVLDGGTLVPPDLAGPVATAVIDRTGLGEALAAPAYSPYGDAGGVVNARAGTAVPGEAVAPTRARVGGRPPQQQTLQAGAARVRLAAGPVAEAAATSPSVLPGTRVRAGEVASFAGRTGDCAASHAEVVLTGVQIGELRIDAVRLEVASLADGAIGSGRASSTLGTVTFAGQRYEWTAEGLTPLGVRLPKEAGLAAWGVEVLSNGNAGHATSGNVSRAWAHGPMLRIATDDGRTATVVLGWASATAERGRL